MALHIVSENGRTGQVIIKDDGRNGLGAFFVCDRFDGPGIAAPPEAEEPHRGRFPWLETIQAAIEPEAASFVITVDLSNLGPGLQVFETATFLDQAMRFADADTVTISETDAPAWGYLGRRGEPPSAGAPQ